MKFVLAALLGMCQAVQLEGIDVKELHEGNHWRKAWPEGNVDVSEGDSEILNRFNVAEEEDLDKVVPPHVWHTYEPHTLSFKNEFQQRYTEDDDTPLPSQ